MNEVRFPCPELRAVTLHVDVLLHHVNMQELMKMIINWIRTKLCIQRRESLQQRMK